MTDFDRSDEPRDTEQRFAALLDDGFRPEPMDFERRAAFDRALRARIERRPRRALVLWLPAAVAAAAALLWIATALDRTPDGKPVGAPESRIAVEETDPAPSSEPVDAAEWSEEILDSVDSLESRYADDVDSLPEEYLAIGSAFMGFDV